MPASGAGTFSRARGLQPLASVGKLVLAEYLDCHCLSDRNYHFARFAVQITRGVHPSDPRREQTKIVLGVVVMPTDLSLKWTSPSESASPLVNQRRLFEGASRIQSNLAGVKEALWFHSSPRLTRWNQPKRGLLRQSHRYASCCELRSGPRSPCRLA